MHPEAMAFLRRARAFLDENAQAITLSTVLDVGSYNVNGSAREVFGDARIYTGIDRSPGPGVDWVSDIRDYAPVRDNGSPLEFDILITTEAMEHDPRPHQILSHAYRLVRPGGYLIATCAAPPRMPHGCMGVPYLPPGEYYSNVQPEAMRSWLTNINLQGGASESTGWWVVEMFEYDGLRGDLYILARCVREDDSIIPPKELIHA